jgi:hypothetical protein
MAVGPCTGIDTAVVRNWATRNRPLLLAVGVDTRYVGDHADAGPPPKVPLKNHHGSRPRENPCVGETFEWS